MPYRLEAIPTVVNFKQLLKIPWIEHTRNDVILRRIQMDRKLKIVIRKIKTASLAQILQRNSCRPLRLTLGEPKVGRPCLSINNFCDLTGLGSHTPLRTTQGRQRFLELLKTAKYKTADLSRYDRQKALFVIRSFLVFCIDFILLT